MESNLVVLQNPIQGLFIVSEENAKFHDPKINPRANQGIEKSVLKEFGSASFKPHGAEAEIAETTTFKFYKYTEDASDGITWVETKGEEPILQ